MPVAGGAANDQELPLHAVWRETAIHDSYGRAE